MSDGSRTQIGDIAPVGVELEESVLRGVSGGQSGQGLTLVDPPGTCYMDHWH